MTPEEIAEGIKIVRGLLDAFEGRATQDDPAMVRSTLVTLVDALMSHGRPERTSDKPPRGVGYGQMGKDGYTTPDEAMIVASLPWFKGNMSAAIRAHYPRADADEVQVHARRIRGRQAEIAELEDDHPWETSSNWLGDLPAE
jgi:hypothetical protein